MVLKRIGLKNIEEYKVTEMIVSKQSSDITLGVDRPQGAGDQGMMFGYATNETAEYLPIPYTVATAIEVLS